MNDEPQQVDPNAGEPEPTNQTDDKQVTMSHEALNERIERASSKAVKDALAAYKAQQKADDDEAKRLAGLSKDQKTAEKLKGYEDKIAELETTMRVRNLSVEASKQLAEKGVNLSSDELIDLGVITGDADQVMAAVEHLAKTVNEAADIKFKNATKGKTPGIATGTNNVVSEGVKFAKKFNEAQQSKVTKSMFSRDQ